MGPKQTTPQGDNPAGKKEGQDGATPVFSFTGTSATSSSPLSGPSVTSPNEPGALGSDTLSTGANVSRTMDSLNNRDQATHGGLVFAKHRFDKIDPKTGDILLTPDEEPKKKGFFATLFGGGRRKQAPESVSMVENRHKDVVIPEQYQNPGRKKRRQEPVQPAQTQTVAQPTPTTAQSASVQPTPTPTPVPPVVSPTQTAAPISSQPTSTPTPTAPRKSRKIQTIALIGVIAVIAIIVVGVLITNTMNNNRKNYYQSTSNTSNSDNGSNSTTASESSVRELANIYINTVLFNSPSKATTTAPYFTDKTYYLKDILLGQLSSGKTIAEKQEFLKNILELYEEFSSALDSSIYADYPTTIATIDSYGNNLRSYVDYYVNPKTDDSTSYTTEEESLAINNIIIGCWTITKNLDNPIKSNVDSSMYASSETNGNGVSQ